MYETEFRFQVASLIIPAAKQRDSGNFSCNPSNSDAITVMLHVIMGECVGVIRIHGNGGFMYFLFPSLHFVAEENSVSAVTSSSIEGSIRNNTLVAIVMLILAIAT